MGASVTVAEIMESIRAKNALEKTAAAAETGKSSEEAQADAEMVKLAEDLYLGGRIFGQGVVAELLSKLAEDPIPAKGQAADSAGNEAEAMGSQFGSVVKKLQAFHGGQTPGSAPKVQGTNPNVVRETVATPGDKDKNPNPPEKAGG